ncbi:MAG: hypothetical protein P8R00_02880 [Candidatus Poseidoniaceae archaeon]|nr:hypothetical protein [Candidatus Poseidoniaceae archaeon]
MADKELEGASLPTGIEVDDAAAYFGVIESSDMVHTLMAMEQEKAMEQFFSILSDVVLLPGDFDFEAASERIQCEGGEIYYLVAGHLGLMSLPDPLSQYLGLPDSSGDSSGQSPSLSEEEQSKLATLADPMRILKLLAIASTTGSEGEVTRYLNTLKQLFADPASHTATLLAVADELDASLDVAGHALPVPSLASGKAAAAPIASAPVSLPKPAPSMPEPVGEVPLPPVPQVEKEVDLPDLPLPSEVSSAVELPSVEPVVVAEPELDTNNERMVARAEEDAFSGAFDLGLGKEEPEVSVPNPAPEPVEEMIQEPVLEPAPVPVEDVPEPAEEEEFVSAAEHFLAADTDGSRELSVEELAVATGTSLEEAKELHEQADADGDGTVSLSEFISSPAAEKTQSLPRPVAPVRKPLAQQPQPAQQQPVQQPTQQQQGWNQQPAQQQQQGWNQQPAQQQQGWNQPPPQQQQHAWNQQPQQGWNQPQQIQPTIRSGIHCRGCGIGLDPYWRFCPICGTQSGVR